LRFNTFRPYLKKIDKTELEEKPFCLPCLYAHTATYAAVAD
jgi:hypothetical protein